jgi:hypothetical protein
MQYFYAALMIVVAIIVLTISSRLAKDYLWIRIPVYAIVGLIVYVGWGVIFPSAINNEPLRSAIEEYVRAEFRNSDLQLDPGVREYQINDIIILKDSFKEGVGSARARISGTYLVVSNDGGGNQVDFKVDHAFSYRLRDDTYTIESHVPLLRLFK